MMTNLGDTIVMIYFATTSINYSRETKNRAIKKYLETTGFSIIDISNKLVIAKIPDGWTMKLSHDGTVVGVCDKNGNMRIENYHCTHKNKSESICTRFKCRYEVCIVSDSKNHHTTYMVDNASGKKKVFSVLPYHDSKQIMLAEKVMRNVFPRMDNSLAYWK